MTSVVTITSEFAGEVGVVPRLVRVNAPGYTYANITTAGWLNTVGGLGNPIQSTDIIAIYYSGGRNWFYPSFSGSVITLNPLASAGEVVLPVVDGNVCVFSGTLGVIDDRGYSPSDAAKTKMVMANGAVVANRFAKFTDTAGTVDDATSAGTNLGDIYAGADAVAGAFRSYSATTATGYLGLTAVANSGAFAVQIANVSHGQSTIHSIVDPGNAAARFLVGATATPFTSGNFPVASGTGGLMVDSGLAATNIQNKTNIKAATTANIGGAGAGPLTITVAGATTASVIVASIATSSNTVAVAKVTPGTGNFDLLLDGDPGATLTVSYIAMIAAQ